jgi:hypothetical protein
MIKSPSKQQAMDRYLQPVTPSSQQQQNICYDVESDDTDDSITNGTSSSKLTQPAPRRGGIIISDDDDDMPLAKASATTRSGSNADKDDPNFSVILQPAYTQPTSSKIRANRGSAASAPAKNPRAARKRAAAGKHATPPRTVKQPLSQKKKQSAVKVRFQWHHPYH